MNQNKNKINERLLDHWLTDPNQRLCLVINFENVNINKASQF